MRSGCRWSRCRRATAERACEENMTRLLGICLLLFTSQVFSEEIRVLSGGAARAFVEPLASSFPGHTVKLEYQPMGKLVQSLAPGPAAGLGVGAGGGRPAL